MTTVSTQRQLAVVQREMGPEETPALVEVYAHIEKLLDQLAQSPAISAEEIAELRDSFDSMRDLASLHANLHRGLLQASPDAITIHVADGQIVDANPAAERIFGYSKAELISIGLQGLNPDLRENHMEAWWQNVGAGGTDVVDTRNRRADGVMIPVRVRSIAFAIGDRHLVAAIARDISDENARSNALKESDARFQELFSAVDKGVCIHSNDGRLLAINPVAQRILDLGANWQPGQVSGRHTKLYDHNAEPIAPEDEPVHRAGVYGESTKNRVIGLHNLKTQEFTWISISVTPNFRPGQVRPFQVMTIFSDITELKRASEFFDETQKLANIGCWDADVKTGRVYWSDKMFSMMERTPTPSLKLDQVFSHVHPADRELIRNWWEQMQIEPRAVQHDMRLITMSNKVLWMRVSGTPQLLDGKLWRMMGTSQDITESKLEQVELTKRAQIDHETGLINRDTALRRLQRKLDSHSNLGPRELQSLQALPGLVLIDFERLHLLETIVGERAASTLLLAAVQRLQEYLPKSAELARFSDVEILVVLEVSNEAELWQYADLLSQAFGQPFASGGEEFLLNPAIGVARYPSDGNRLPLLLRHLDAATKEAKQRSGGWQGFSAGLALKLRQGLQLEAQLRKGLELNEFTLVYQPKISLRTNALIGVEALIRWNNHILGELSPSLFIPYAESTGDIVPIGAWVLKAAAQQMRRWLDAGIDVAHIAVNVSFRQFLSERFVRDVHDALRENNLPGHCLELELTERVFIDDGDETQNTIADLRKLGVRIVIDDFGEGYSALGYLRRLNVHAIKISHHFMREIPHSDVDTKVCRAMIMMADSLGLDVIAEGVETPAQCDFLLSHGAEVVQGFLFSAPLRPEALAEFVIAQKSYGKD